MSLYNNQDNISSPNEHEDQPERSAIDPRERGASGSVPAPEGVCPCNTPNIIDNTSDNPLKLNNQSTPEGRVLQAGIDTLALSVYCEWDIANEINNIKPFIEQLKDLKQDTIRSGAKTTGAIRELYSDGAWNFVIQPKGIRGYNLVLNGEDQDFTLQVYEGENAGNRPRVMIEFRSQYLHSKGHEDAIKRALGVLRDTGARIKVNGVLVSRMDMYCDYLDRGENIDSNTRKSIASKAGHKRNMFENDGEFETLYVGPKGADIQLRIYDKKKNLKELGKEGALNSEWKLSPGEEECKIFRVEYQLKRPALKKLGIDKAKDITENKDRLWGYLTQEWSVDLKKDDKHKERRETKKYWKEIQQAFVQDEDGPAIEKQERLKITVTNPWATAREVYKSFIKFLAECIVTATRLPEEISVQTAIEAWAKFVIWIPDMNNEDFEAKVRQEVSKIRNRKDEEKAKIIKKAKSIINLKDKYPPSH